MYLPGTRNGYRPPVGVARVMSHSWQRAKRRLWAFTLPMFGPKKRPPPAGEWSAGRILRVPRSGPGIGVWFAVGSGLFFLLYLFLKLWFYFLCILFYFLLYLFLILICFSFFVTASVFAVGSTVTATSLSATSVALDYFFKLFFDIMFLLFIVFCLFVFSFFILSFCVGLCWMLWCILCKKVTWGLQFGMNGRTGTRRIGTRSIGHDWAKGYDWFSQKWLEPK